MMKIIVRAENKRLSGFTLAELLVVIFIVGLIGGFFVVFLSHSFPLIVRSQQRIQEERTVELASLQLQSAMQSSFDIFRDLNTDFYEGPIIFPPTPSALGGANPAVDRLIVKSSTDLVWPDRDSMTSVRDVSVRYFQISLEDTDVIIEEGIINPMDDFVPLAEANRRRVIGRNVEVLGFQRVLSSKKDGEGIGFDGVRRHENVDITVDGHGTIIDTLGNQTTGIRYFVGTTTERGEAIGLGNTVTFLEPF